MKLLTAALLLLRVCWEALHPPRPVCPACVRHQVINRELSARLVERTVADPPVLVVRVPSPQPSFSVYETPGPPEAPGLPALPPVHWPALYQAPDEPREEVRVR